MEEKTMQTPGAVILSAARKLDEETLLEIRRIVREEIAEVEKRFMTELAAGGDSSTSR